MKVKKTDQRSRYTQFTIRKSLLSLLAKKTLKEISVSELCKTAQITRGTFYNHFYDVFDVYDSIEQEFIDQLKERVESTDVTHLDNKFIFEIIQLIYDNYDLISVLVGDFKDTMLFEKVYDFAREKYISEFIVKRPDIDSSKIKMVFTYIVNGSMGLLIEWIESGMVKTCKVISDEISGFARVLCNAYFGEKLN